MQRLDQLQLTSTQTSTQLQLISRTFWSEELSQLVQLVVSVIVLVEKGTQTEMSWNIIEVDLKFELKLIEFDPVTVLTLRNSPLPIGLVHPVPMKHLWFHNIKGEMCVCHECGWYEVAERTVAAAVI